MPVAVTILHLGRSRDIGMSYGLCLGLVGVTLPSCKNDMRVYTVVANDLQHGSCSLKNADRAQLKDQTDYMIGARNQILLESQYGTVYGHKHFQGPFSPSGIRSKLLG